jgi:N-acylneuraminate cytidylyltransferase
MQILCLIPARSGSKRIPGKNIKPLGDKPLIAHTIECAKKVPLINRIIVTTNDEETMSIAMEYGVETPFRRPDEISTADSTDFEFCSHAIYWLEENESYKPDMIVLLRPTAPFRKPESVIKAINLLMDNPDADSVRSVKLCTEHPHKMWIIENDSLKSLIPLEQKLPQAHTLSYHLLPTVYVQNANIDVMWTRTIREKKSITGENIIPLIMNEHESLDINQPRDFLLAERLVNS